MLVSARSNQNGSATLVQNKEVSDESEKHHFP